MTFDSLFYVGFIADHKTYLYCLSGFVSLIFKNIKNDSASLIQLFLGTLEDKVIKNTLIPKTARVRMLAEPKVLLNVSSLFKWDGVMDIEQVIHFQDCFILPQCTFPTLYFRLLITYLKITMSLKIQWHRLHMIFYFIAVVLSNMELISKTSPWELLEG